MTLGEQLKKIRAEKGLSQPELAELASIEQSYLSKLENDKSLPSNEVFRKLLSAFSLTVAQFIEPLNTHYIKNNLLLISDIEQLYQQASTKQLNQQRKLLYIASSLIVIAITLFYTGFSKQVFNETVYEYRSDGVVLAGEPSNVFWTWRSLINSKDSKEYRDKKNDLSVSINQRSDILIRLLSENKGESFVDNVEGGTRWFFNTKREVPLHKPKAINAWLQVLGVLFLASGFMGFVLERRLFMLRE